MSELGVPYKVTCAHTVPAFGCQACIDSEREKTLADFVKVNPAPLCPECKTRMTHIGTYPLKMTVEYGCPRLDKDGENFCEDPGAVVEVKVR